MSPKDHLARLTRPALVILVTTGLCALALRYVPLIKVAENWTHDIRIATLTPATPQSEDIVIVAVTEETLAAFPYRSPLDRGFLANLIKALEAKDVRLIGLDMLFDQPTEPDKDERLHRTLEDLSVPVVVAWADASDGLTDDQSRFLARYVRGLPHGSVEITPDAVDGAVRTIPLREDAGEQRSAFAAVAARLVGAQLPDAKALRLDYRGRPGRETRAFPVYPAHAVELLPHSWFRGRIALVGAVLPLQDRHRTPFSAAPGAGDNLMPGVIIHAHALSQLLEGRSAPNLAPRQTMLVIAAFAALGVLLAALRLPLSIKMATGLLGGALTWAGAFLLYGAGGPLLPLVTPTLALLVSGGTMIQLEWQRERARRRFIHTAFARFVAPTVVHQLVAEPERLKLNGERRELSFLFTDIAGFTALTESTDPETLVGALNQYLDETCRIVLRHEGTLDKIVGDALHVFFNAPLDQPDHAQRAVACALDLDRFCEHFARTQRQNGVDFGATRIGVNTGITVVGNVGGEARFDYSAHGDAINTAARLESLNKHLGTRICVAGATSGRCPSFTFRPIGRVLLRGKAAPIEVFEALQGAQADEALLAEYRAAYELLEEDDPRARAAFERLAQRYPDDKLILFHESRLAAGETGVLMAIAEK